MLNDACFVPRTSAVGRSHLHPTEFSQSYDGPVTSTLCPDCSATPDWNWLHGQRIGEAANPGPAHQLSLLESFRQTSAPPHSDEAPQPRADAAIPSDAASSISGAQLTDGSSQSRNLPVHTDFRLAVVNPTAVLGKEADILDLQQDMVLLSETSAVERAQRLAASAFGKAQCYSQWSPPVPPHATGQDSLRGHAEGTAVISKYPLRGSFAGRPEIWQGSCRLVEAIARVGWFSFRVIAVYGFPANRAEAALRNDELFRWALQVATRDHLPAIIGGDFNCCIQSLPVWDEYRALGFRETFEFWEARTGTVLPPTCRAATRHDTVVLPPIFQQMLCKAAVSTHLHLFDSHAPLMLEFCIPASPILQYRWRMPRSWATLEVDPQAFDAEYACRRGECQAAIQQCQDRDDVDQAFVTWASQVEAAVDACLRANPSQSTDQQHGPGLPKACRGRFQFRPRLKFPLPCPARQARHGDYNPPNEVMSVIGCAKIKQARRLRTFAAGLAKARKNADWSPGVCRQLGDEWAAIKRAPGYSPTFAHWLLCIAHFHVFWEAWPPAEWLEDVVAYVAYDADILAKAEAKRAAQLRTYKAHQDASCNHAKGHYAALRKPMRPPITAIPKLECQQAVKVQDLATDVASYRLPFPSAFVAALPTTADGAAVQIQGLLQGPDESEVLQIHFPGRPPPAHCCLQQQTEASTGPELHRAFFEYWAPIWLRDKAADCQHDLSWGAFLQHLPPVPPEAASLGVFDSFAPTAWLDRAKHLKSGKATGYDGISNAELKALPFQALSDLSEVFRQCSRFGWPTHIASATVSSLAKNDCPQGLHHSRPITILATSYRLWASVAAKGILRAWNQWFPKEILGCLPGRSSRDLSLSLECLIEQARLAKEPLLGFSIDLVKAFNNLPRRPLQELLLHLQVPPVIVKTWFSFLDRVARFPIFHDSLGVGLPSSTGVPEGDPLSVVAMLAVCYAAHHWPRNPNSVLRSYVDNFTWTCTEPAALPDAVASAREFCSALRLPIDWTKSYCWATLSSHRRWLSQIAPSLVPDGSQLRVVDGAKDLGVSFRFGPRATKAHVTSRLQHGHDRLQKLGAMSRPLELKARLMLGSVWPATFYGTEGHKLSVAQISSLRTAAARALVGKHSSTSPILALTCLCARVLDPGVYALAQSLCALARLLRVCPEQGNWWLQTASQTDGTVRRTLGPATTLAWRLAEHGWVLKPDGLLKGPDHWRCHLRTSSSSAIKDLLAWVQQHVPHWLHCPFAVEHEQECFSRLFWESRKLLPPPSISDLVVAHKLDRLCLYTDGSCNHNSCPAARHAAWAVVLDLRPLEQLPPGLEEQRLAELVAERFVIVAQGVVPGRQTNNRAEFCALLQAGRIASSIPALPSLVGSDSQFGLRAQSRLQACPELPRESNVADLGDGDVANWFPASLRGHKVQAHRCLRDVPTDELVCAAGNFAADLAAKQALQNDLPLAGSICSEIAAWRREQGHVVVPARRALRQQTVGAAAGPGLTNCGEFSQWLAFSPEETQPLTPRAFPAEGFPTGGWPLWFLEKIWQWVFQLQWGRQDHLDKRDRGITYLELLANFVVCTAACPPVPGDGAKVMLDQLATEGILQPLYVRNAIAFMVQAV
ncbi:unnamed protein product, partial [Symbiodinium sp. CCMP2456]